MGVAAAPTIGEVAPPRERASSRIRGEKKAEKEEKDKNYHITKRSYGSFYRALELPHGVREKDIKASLANGVLKVTLPKPKPANARKIAVKTAD